MRVELCPTCGSGKVGRTSVIADTFKCDNCGWTGAEREVLVTEVAASVQDIAVGVAQALLVTLAQEASIPIGRALFSSGLLPKNTDSKLVGRVMRATLTAACQGALGEISLIQKEMVDGPTDTRAS